MIIGLVVTGAVVLISSVVLHLTCHQHNRPAYRVPFFPYAPAASLLLNCFLMASLPANAYWQLGLFFGLVSLFYVFYSIHAGTFWEKKQGRGVLATTVPAPHRPESLRVASSFRENPSYLMPYSTPSHTAAMHGRWSGGVVRLPAEF
jgi:APA family basic amino acid/polyamine antiporter